MADTPTPRSYRIPPISPDSEPPIDRYRQELRDITSLLYDVRTQIKNLRNEVEEIKGVEERAAKGGTIPPVSLRTIVTRKRAIIAALVALLTALPEIIDQIQHAVEAVQQQEIQEEHEHDGSAR